MIKDDDTIAKIGRLMDSIRYHCPENVLNTILLNANLTDYDLSVLTGEIDASNFNDIEYDDVVKYIDDMALQDDSVFRDLLEYIIGCYDRDELKQEMNKIIKDKYNDITIIDLYKFSDLGPSAQKQAIIDHIDHTEAHHQVTIEWSDARKDLLEDDDYRYDVNGYEVKGE